MVKKIMKRCKVVYTNFLRPDLKFCIIQLLKQWKWSLIAVFKNFSRQDFQWPNIVQNKKLRWITANESYLKLPVKFEHKPTFRRALIECIRSKLD